MDTNNDDEIVYIPIPRRYLPALYRALPSIMEEASGQAETSLIPTPDASKRNLIDLIIDVAQKVGADQKPVFLKYLNVAYLRAYPGIGKGVTRNSFDATLNYHCINMRSRFPDPNDKHKPAPWLSRPAFKRTGRAFYMLLSPDEIACFHRCVKANHPLIYDDEYDVDDLKC